jgi:hypothetical protein
VRRLIALALCVLALGLARPGAAGEAACSRDRLVVHGADGPVAFRVELALTPEEQARGLMFRPSLPREAGMLFVYDPPRKARFWMKNTMIPLDMIFIDETGRIESIAERTTPYSLSTHESEGPVRGILEINGGLSDALGIAPGAQVVHPAFEAAPPEHRCPPPG